MEKLRRFRLNEKHEKRRETALATKLRLEQDQRKAYVATFSKWQEYRNRRNAVIKEYVAVKGRIKWAKIIHAHFTVRKQMKATLKRYVGKKAMLQIMFGIKMYLFRLTNKFRISSINDKHIRYCR